MPLVSLHTYKRVFTIGTDKPYPNCQLPVAVDASAAGSPYNIVPQSSQGSALPALVSNSGNSMYPRPTYPFYRLISEFNTGVVTRWNGRTNYQTTVTSGSSYTKVETYSKWVRAFSFKRKAIILKGSMF